MVARFTLTNRDANRRRNYGKNFRISSKDKKSIDRLANNFYFINNSITPVNPEVVFRDVLTAFP